MDFDTTKNLFIEGDNLDALKLLQETYLGKVKLIYIDPPYNTGNDFIYEDDFAEDSDRLSLEVEPEDESGQSAGREYRIERPIPFGLADHDVSAAEAGEKPSCR